MPPDNPLTLGAAARASAQLIVWCKTCLHQNAADPADAADVYGAELAIVEWRKRLYVRSAAAGISRRFLWVDVANDTDGLVRYDGSAVPRP
jgi:hypothetical protein